MNLLRGVLGGLLVAAAIHSGLWAETDEEEDYDARSHELFRRECLTESSRQDLTLFANGTLRLREGPRGRQRMVLAELAPDELKAVIRRIEEEGLSETWSRDSGLRGIGVETCRLLVQLAEHEPIVYYYGRFQSRSLALSRIVNLADELVALTMERTPGESLPRGYVAEPGDVLRRGDGVLFEVVGFTSDGKGVELVGVEQPLLIYVEKDALHGEFAAIVRRKGFVR